MKIIEKILGVEDLKNEIKYLRDENSHIKEQMKIFSDRLYTLKVYDEENRRDLKNINKRLLQNDCKHHIGGQYFGLSELLTLNGEKIYTKECRYCGKILERYEGIEEMRKAKAELYRKLAEDLENS